MAPSAAPSSPFVPVSYTHLLSTGLAGEILQKFVNYGGRIAIYGDYSHYTSKPLKDFIYESNNGKDVFFVSSLEEAVEKLTK